MEEIWRRIEAWLKDNVPEGVILMNPSSTEAEIQQAETTLEIRFPQDFRTFLKIHNGEQWESRGLMEGWRFHSLDDIVEDWSVWKEIFGSGPFDAGKTRPDPGVRDDWWNPGWIPIVTNDGGDSYCLDMAPDPGGREGQIIWMWHDMSDRSVEASSFRKWMENLAQGMESGKYFFHEEEGNIVVAGEEDEEA
jgi:cell wall assembly regulator SMI1